MNFPAQSPDRTDRGGKTTVTPGGVSFLDHYLAYLLAKASHLVSSGFHAELKALGIPVSTWRILATVREGERSVGTLADIVLFNQPTLSKALDRLEADGLVRRTRYDDRRRNVFISITEKGRHMVDDLLSCALAHEKDVLSEMDGNERNALKSALSKLIARLE